MISVIIPTCNRNDLLSKCLELLSPINQTIEETYEVIVTDDSKENIASKLIKEKYNWVKWVEGPKLGPAANRNNGAKNAKGDWLVFLDDDCEPNSNLLQTYSINANQNVSYNAFEGSIVCNEKIINPLYTSPVNEKGGYLWSCNFAIRKATFELLKGFDENFKYPNLEDNDLHYRLKVHHNKILFLQDAFVVHPPRLKASPRKFALYHESWLYYHRKIGTPKSLFNLLVTILKNRIRDIYRCRLSLASLKALCNCFLEICLTSVYYNTRYTFK
jgi:GT2 family glycosyltransferase